jgi:hypothetical protein
MAALNVVAATMVELVFSILTRQGFSGAALSLAETGF